MTSKYLVGGLMLAMLGALGCDKPAETPTPTPPAETTAPTPATNNAAPATNNAPATQGAAEAPSTATQEVDAALLDPSKWKEKAPDKFSVKFDTTEGEFTVDLHRDWAPLGVDQFYNLVKAGYYTDIAAFRVIGGFMAQFGIHGAPTVNQVWREAKIKDDAPKSGVSNTAGHLTFAMAGPDTRTVQLFISFGDNSSLDGQGFRPIGKVAGNGMEVVKKWHDGYGEGAPRGKGPDQGRLQAQGNEYLRKDFPNLSYIKSITLVDGAAAAATTKTVKAAPAKKWEAGAFQQKDITSGDISEASMRISVKDDGTVVGSFQGKREGKAFSVPLKGNITDSGTFTAEGERAKNTMKMTGMYKSGELHGACQGMIHDRAARVAFKATK